MLSGFIWLITGTSGGLVFNMVVNLHIPRNAGVYFRR
jgi:hypothetical protein